MKYFWSLIILFVMACGETQQENSETTQSTTAASDSLYKAAMDGHNVGMAKIGEVKRLQNVIQGKLDSLQQVNAPTNDYNAVLEQLKKADEGMTAWMQEFDPNLAGDTEASKVAYYQQEKDKVDVVTNDILNSIKAAEQLSVQ